VDSGRRTHRRPRPGGRHGGDGDSGETSSEPTLIRVLFDIQALQNRWSAERGIGRHVRELGLALGSMPEIEPWFLLNRDLPVPRETSERFRTVGEVSYSDERGLPRGAVYHVPSPLEPSPLARVWPRRLRSNPLVVTLHDLIPAVFPKENMPDTGVRRAYWARLELARHADRVLNVSQATARDATRLLGLRPEKMAVTGGGVSDDFKPPASPDAARAALRDLWPALDSEYVLFTGGMDYRKNTAGLLDAYAGLPQDVRQRFALVVVGRLAVDDAHDSFREQADALGISDRLVLTGHVSDDELILLYQASSLFVFPSLYEGFGLPVVEAFACGAPAIVGRNSSLVELVTEEEALFDSSDPASIGAALGRALTDEKLRERLRRPEIRERFTWPRIAELTAAAYRLVVPKRAEATIH
jgi:glycosyltransferase involved in cell wall biosynthesis